MDKSGIAVILYTLNLPSLKFFSVWSSIVKPLRVRCLFASARMLSSSQLISCSMIVSNLSTFLPKNEEKLAPSIVEECGQSESGGVVGHSVDRR